MEFLVASLGVCALVTLIGIMVLLREISEGIKLLRYAVDRQTRAATSGVTECARYGEEKECPNPACRPQEE